jgi:hypothetical protein
MAVGERPTIGVMICKEEMKWSEEMAAEYRSEPGLSI